MQDYNKVLPYYLNKLPKEIQEGYYYEKGTMEFDLGLYNYSVANFSKLVEIKPTPIYYTWRAMANVMIGQYKSAQNDMNIVDNLCKYDKSNDCSTALYISKDIRPYLYDTSY